MLYEQAQVFSLCTQLLVSHRLGKHKKTIGGISMFGMESVGIALIWMLTIASTLGCIAYGAIMWNRGGDAE